MAKRNQEVIPFGNAWLVKAEGAKKFTIITEKQRDAIMIARSIAKHNKADLIIYDKKGNIRKKDSYAVA